MARRVLVASTLGLPLAVLIALLTTGVMSRWMLQDPGWVALAQCLHPWTDGGSFLYPCAGEDVFVGGSSAGAADHLLYTSGAVTFNEQGASADFRVEGDNNPDVIHTIASADRVAIGSDGASALLDVTAGGTSAVTTNCVQVIHNCANDSDACDLNIIGGDAGTTRVCFGDTDDPTIGVWVADASTDECSFTTDTLKMDCGMKIKRTGVITSAYTIAATDYYVSCSSTGGTFVVTLPSASSAGAGKVYVVKNNGSVNQVTLTPDGSPTGDKIDGANTKALTALQGVTIVSDGTSNWEIIAKPN